jgi:NitT/TauT family transport system substrate-binding protein
MALEQVMITPWVKENGVGGIDRPRFEKALDQIGLTFAYRQKPKVEEIFVDTFLPPAAERKVDGGS